MTKKEKLINDISIHDNELPKINEELQKKITPDVILEMFSEFQNNDPVEMEKMSFLQKMGIKFTQFYIAGYIEALKFYSEAVIEELKKSL